MSEPTELTPVDVRVISVPPTEKTEAPGRLSTRTYNFPPVGLGGPPVIAVAGRNNARSHLVLRAASANTQPCFITDDSDAANISRAFQMEAGVMVTLEGTHALYAWGTAGDQLSVAEESYSV